MINFKQFNESQMTAILKREINFGDLIYNFIDKYAIINLNWKSDDVDEEENTKYVGVDVYELKSFADNFKKGIINKKCWSEYSSGCYQPINSKKGQKEHDEILKNINDIIRINNL